VIADTRFVIVGVLQAEFHGLDLAPVEAWVPLGSSVALMPHDVRENPSTSMLKAFARLETGVPAVAAAAALNSALRVHSQEYGSIADYQLTLVPILSDRGPDGSSVVAIVLLLLKGLSLIVALVACANVTNLLLARGLTRETEFGIRIALGASRLRLAQLVIIESLALAVAGAILSIPLSAAGFRLVRDLYPTLNLHERLLSGHALFVAATAAAVVGIANSLLPIVQVLRTRAVGMGRLGPFFGIRRSLFIRSGLVSLQIALCIALIDGVIVSAQALVRVVRNPLTRLEGVVVLDIDVDRLAYSPDRADDVFEVLYERASRDPRILRSALAGMIPLRRSTATYVTVAGIGPVRPLASGGPYIDAVGHDYFDILGIEIVKGRRFTALDDQEQGGVAIVNAAVMQAVWRGRSPLGECLRIGSDKACHTIVGVAQDIVRETAVEGTTLQIYVPVHHGPTYLRPRAFFVRAETPTTAREFIQDQLRALHVPLSGVRVDDAVDLIAPELRVWRSMAVAFGVFSGMALLIAALGVYGLVTYRVEQRRAEYALRIALGAPATDLVFRVVRSCSAEAAAGVVIGLVCTVAAGRLFLSHSFLSVSPQSPGILAAAAGVLFGLSVGVGIRASRGILRSEPMYILKESGVYAD
jgi:predicted permease